MVTFERICRAAEYLIFLFYTKCRRIYECYQIMLGGSEELQSEAASWPAGCSLPPPPFTPSSQAAATATPANATHKSSFIDQYVSRGRTHGAVVSTLQVE